MDTMHQTYQMWATDPYFPDWVREELQGLSEEEIQDRFQESLQFGTGGLRGILGAGTNRINLWTIAWATEGFAEYILQQGESAVRKGICIAYDSRRLSRELAEVTALVLTKHGIHVRLFPELAPTPVLSYAVRYYQAAGGVMITASHNPAQYNGYKAYGPDGGQLPPAAADVVIEAMRKITDVRTLTWMDRQEALDSGLLEYVPSQLQEDYFAMLSSLSISRDLVQKHADMRVVYTPLNGAGNAYVRRVLAESGLQSILVVPQQEKPDPDFTTCPYPNPEDRAALQLAIDLAQQEEADLVLATDPDSDRMGACLRMPDGSYRVLTGNQIGMLLMDYILSAKQERGILPPNSFVATTIVSTRLVHRIAEQYGVKLYEVLTGFKFIGELIAKRDEQGCEHFQFGFEESYGYLAGTSVRDKDAVVAAMLLVELAATCAEEGQNLADRLESLYQKYGYGLEKTLSFTLEGVAGVQQIQTLLQSLRKEVQPEWAGLPIQARRDYQSRVRIAWEGEDHPTEYALHLPTSNVLLYELEGMDWACVRPSGTEPKLKVYLGCYGATAKGVEEKMHSYLNKIKAEIESRLNA